ncbi:MAG TPA: glycosyltransferase [Mesotoga infera]|jgi:glycosyltransferase involved in cell wall biosynthesis|nr:glycosyltransferase [Mesotoga infera]HRR43948.1 glycosyltransferase [Mesotoga sp.]HRV02541.1 glycosyltransferase [Mesotoga sp.]
MRQFLIIVDSLSANVSSISNIVRVLKSRKSIDVRLLILKRKPNIIYEPYQNFKDIKFEEAVIQNSTIKIYEYLNYFRKLKIARNVKKDSDLYSDSTDIVLVGDSCWELQTIDHKFRDLLKRGNRIFTVLLELPTKYLRLSLARSIIYGKEEMRAIRLSDKVIVPNKERKELIMRLFPNKQIGVIHNYPQIDQLTVQRENDDEPTAENPYFCHTGLVKSYRLPKSFLEAFEEYYSKHKIKLVVAGKIYGRIKKHIEDGAKQDFLDYLGSVDRRTSINIQRKAFGGLAIYLPKDVNNYLCAPQKIYEYLNNGVPVFCSSNPPLIDLIEKNNLGVTVKEFDRESIIRGLERFTVNHNEFRKSILDWKSKTLNPESIENEIAESFDLVDN